MRQQGVERGIGIAAFIKGTAPGPLGYYGSGGAPISLQDACVIKLEPNGGVICAVGVTEQGQGTNTIMGQVAATALGVPMSRARYFRRHRRGALRRRHLRFTRSSHRRRGRLPGGARAKSGNFRNCRGAAADGGRRCWTSVDGVVVDAAGTRRLPLAEIGRICHFQLGELPNGLQPVLSHTRRFWLTDDLYIFTNGMHGAYVEIDTDTGLVRLLKHWVVEDCGRLINPQLADEQVRGGCVQGIGGALYEHLIYNRRGQLTNGTLGGLSGADGRRNARYRRGARGDAELGERARCQGSR